MLTISSYFEVNGYMYLTDCLYVPPSRKKVKNLYFSCHSIAYSLARKGDCMIMSLEFENVNCNFNPHLIITYSYQNVFCPKTRLNVITFLHFYMERCQDYLNMFIYQWN